MKLRGGMFLLLVLLWGAVAAADTYTVPVRAVGCRTLAYHVYNEVPRLFLTGDADSLLGLVERWDTDCGPHELITRVRLLGAIWDGAFGEELYDAAIIDDLMVRADEFRQGPAPDPARARFDSFTVDLADQMLPHQDPDSLEEFFCLFYAGRTAEAWVVLDRPDLAGTSLAFYRRLTMEQIRAQGHWTVALAAGTWNPDDDLSWVGSQPLLGINAGIRGSAWLARLVAEIRPGRTGTPYWVQQDGVDYLSDRWSTVLLGGEVGRHFALAQGWDFQVFGGIGSDLIRPFVSDDLVLGSLHTSLGIGMRSHLMMDEGWVWGMDLRREWIADRNEDSVNLGGTAWSLRFVIEWLSRRGRPYEVELLTH